MYIEDLITTLNSIPGFQKLLANPYRAYQLDMIESFSLQINKQIALTGKQREAAIKILKSNKSLLTDTLGQEALKCLDNPIFKMDIRQRQDMRQVSIVQTNAHPFCKRVIQLNISYNPPLVQQIRNTEFLKNKFIWNSRDKAWQVALTEENIFHIKQVTEKLNFSYSDEFLELAEKCDQHFHNMDKIVPMLDLNESGMLFFRNVSPYVPELETQEIISALFEARKKGITVWSDSVREMINESNINKITRQFLESEANSPFEINCTENHVSCLTDIIKHMTPAVFIIPGGNEVEKLTLVQEFLNSIDITADQVSVLFRLSSIKNATFNKLVKEFRYNNALNNDTKIAIISDKIRKPLIQSNIKFHTVINFGTINGAHITMRNFIRMSENVINYSEVSKQRRLHFGVL